MEGTPLESTSSTSDQTVTNDSFSTTMIENIPPDANSSSNTAIIVSTNNRTVSFYGLENIWTQDYSKNFPDFDLKTLLTVSPYGSKILNYYQTNDRLTDFLRNKLVDMIITQLYPYIIKQ